MASGCRQVAGEDQGLPVCPESQRPAQGPDGHRLRALSTVGPASQAVGPMPPDRG